MNRNLTKLPAGEQISPLPINSPRRSRFQNLQNFCQQQIEQLADRLPLITGWIVYQDFETQKRQTIKYNTVKKLPFYLNLPDLQSEALSVLRLHEIHWQDAARARAYICPLDEYNPHANYLLLLLSQPLSVLEQEWVEQQAKGVSDHIAVCRECDRQQQQLQLLEQALQRAEHQLRNPLALISLYAENLCLSLTEPLQEQADLIRETANELNTALTDLFNYGKQVQLRLEIHDLQAILIESIRGLHPWIKQKQLQIDYPHTPISLKVDRFQIKQVFDNLLSNAISFSPQAGNITWNWHIFGHEILVEVYDQGPGLSEEDLKNAFTPFYSRRSGGTGLGLAIAQKVILDHQGSLWVQNLPQGGAQFSFSLPR